MVIQPQPSGRSRVRPEKPESFELENQSSSGARKIGLSENRESAGWKAASSIQTMKISAHMPAAKRPPLTLCQDTVTAQKL